MPPPPPPSKPPPKETIYIPRAEHIPSPLPPTLHATLSAELLHNGTISTLRETMDAAATSTGWSEKVRARTLELLREGRGEDEVRGVLRREILGSPQSEEEEEEEEGGEGKEEEGGRGMEVPEGMKTAGWKVVREGLVKEKSGVEVRVKGELVDGWVV